MTSPDARQTVIQGLEASIQAKQAILKDPQLLDHIVAAADCMIVALQAGHKLIFCGNGGSAADAQHLVAEFTGRFVSNDRRPLPALSLNTNSSALTAIANDFHYEDIFARQLQALGQAGDVLIGISTSGNSPNVLKAVDVARALQVVTVGLTGGSGGALQGSVEAPVVVPSPNTQRIQECHIVIGHLWCELIEDAILAQQK